MKQSNFSGTGVLFVAHGSSEDRRAAGATFACAERLRRRVEHVQVGVWKQRPDAIPDALRALDCERVVVIPFGMADGWFTTTIVPPLLGRPEGNTADTWRTDGKLVTRVPSLGGASTMGDLVGLVAKFAVASRFETRDDLALVVVAHGTTRNPRSKDAALAAGKRAKALGGFARVHVCFVDETPAVQDVFGTVTQEKLLVLPFFAGAGPHVTKDIPEALGLPFDGTFGNTYSVGGRTVCYLRPIGASPAIDGVVMARFAEGLQRFRSVQLS